ncbi:MAG: isoamylase early set domain-containing protein [Spirochaeta sp.]|nr:isoamylase early set domain-containing protein [Spirochaeta sp.]
MTDADRLKTIIDLWEDQGRVSAEDLEFFAAALQAGEFFAARNSKLLPLMRRDYEASEMSELMERLQSDSDTTRFQRSTSKRAGLQRAAWKATAGVAAVLAVAFVSYGFGYRQAAHRTEEAQTASIAEAQSPRDAEPVPAGNGVSVRFRVVAPGASQISVVGDFNDWDPQITPMEQAQDGETWIVTTELEPDRAYTYNFVIDGTQFIPDPAAGRTIQDSFGGEKSVISL